MVNRLDTYLGGLGARMAITRNELGLSQARMGSIAPAVWHSRGFWSRGRTAQLAGLIQSFAERDAPLQSDVHLQFLKILDHLIELGDRRAAALQISSLFDLPRFQKPPQIAQIETSK